MNSSKIVQAGRLKRAFKSLMLCIFTSYGVPDQVENLENIIFQYALNANTLVFAILKPPLHYH
jgi:hypothetical protein